MRLIDRLRWGWIAGSTAVLFTSADVISRLAGRKRSAYVFWKCLRLWGPFSLLGHRQRTLYAERFPKQGPLLIVSNHQSNVDVPFLHGRIPVPFLWLSRHDLFDMPFIGMGLKRLGSIPVVRNDRRKAMEAFRSAIEKLSLGQNVMVFPEGTWGDAEGRMRPFKGGVIALSRRTGATVVPLTILGSNQVNPPFTPRVNPGPLTVVVHPPIPASALADLSDDEALNLVRTTIASALPRGAEPADISAALADSSPF